MKLPQLSILRQGDTEIRNGVLQPIHPYFHGKMMAPGTTVFRAKHGNTQPGGQA